jgi:hypothetical protein
MTRGRLIRTLIHTVAAVVVLCAAAACSATAPVSESGAPADMKTGGAGAPQSLTEPVPQAPPLTVQRDVIRTASLEITVRDPAALSEAADTAGSIADDAGGRVDSRTEYGGSTVDRARITLTLRVPVDELDATIGALKQLGTVQALDMRAEDVTGQRVDLDARIRALQTSVDRLLAIMADAKDSEALIQAEGALSQRQAELDGLRAQRTALGDQITYSTLTVDVVAGQLGGPAPQQYRGVSGQGERGWDALLTGGSNLLLLVGLMLPWAGAAAVLAALLFGLYRLLRLRR